MEHGARGASKSVLAHAVAVNEGGVGRRKNTCKSLEFKSKFRRQMRTPGLVKMKVATPTSTLPTPLKRAALWLLQIFMQRFINCSYTTWTSGFISLRYLFSLKTNGLGNTIRISLYTSIHLVSEEQFYGIQTVLGTTQSTRQCLNLTPSNTV